MNAAKARGGSKQAAHSGRASKPAAWKSERALSKVAVSPHTSSAPLELQQKCLDIFRKAFITSFENNAILQEVKGHLYNRDFSTAFDKEEYLRVYASRWSPSRALAYLQVMRDIEDHFQIDEITELNDPPRVVILGRRTINKLVGLAGWLHLRKNESAPKGSRQLQISLVDVADWSNVTEILSEAITTLPALSKYASQAKRDTNKALLEPEDISVSFRRSDVLDQSDEARNALSDTIVRMDLVTFMFTLNELCSISVPQTQQLLARITASVQPGSLLLVVDSPGSYSTVSINGTEKKYPMHWLLDITLLGPPDKPDKDLTTAHWEKLMTDNSRWFRLPENLQYPIELENMRYQIHLYKRLGG